MIWLDESAIKNMTIKCFVRPSLACHGLYQLKPDLSKKILSITYSQCAFFQDLFHLGTPETWFYGLIGPQKMAVLGMNKQDFDISNGMSKFLRLFPNL